MDTEEKGSKIDKWPSKQDAIIDDKNNMLPERQV